MREVRPNSRLRCLNGLIHCRFLPGHSLLLVSFSSQTSPTRCMTYDRSKDSGCAQPPPSVKGRVVGLVSWPMGASSDGCSEGRAT